MSFQLSTFEPERFLTSFDNLEFFFRVLLSAGLGIVLGVERSVRSKEAGIRTHCIVAMAAAVFMILSKYAFMDLNVDGALGVRGADPARITAQVVSGVSFLGAGIIFKHGHNNVSGLTTAAGMWATAAIGMSIGAGLYWLGLGATVMVLVIQLIFHSSPLGYATQSPQKVYVRMLEDPDTNRAFQKLLEEHHCEIDSSSVQRDRGEVELELLIRTDLPITYQEVLDFLRTYKSAHTFRVEN